jgi:hypothetical protein
MNKICPAVQALAKPPFIHIYIQTDRQTDRQTDTTYQKVRHQQKQAAAWLTI